MLARYAFVIVGTRRIAGSTERITTSQDTYRAAQVRRELVLPAREWSLRGPNEGTIEIRVTPDRTHAVVSVDVPWKAGAFMGAKPTRAVATLRVVPVRDSNGDSLRATAIHQTLFAWVGLPFYGAVLAVHDRMPLVFVVVSGMGLFAHLMTQGMWWAGYGSVLRESAALALETVGKAVEAEALPTTTNAD